MILWRDDSFPLNQKPGRYSVEFNRSCSPRYFATKTSDKIMSIILSFALLLSHLVLSSHPKTHIMPGVSKFAEGEGDLITFDRYKWASKSFQSHQKLYRIIMLCRCWNRRRCYSDLTKTPNEPIDRFFLSICICCILFSMTPIMWEQEMHFHMGRGFQARGGGRLASGHNHHSTRLCSIPRRHHQDHSNHRFCYSQSQYYPFLIKKGDVYLKNSIFHCKWEKHLLNLG